MATATKPAEAAEEKKGGGKKKLILILVPALVLLAGAYVLFFRGGEAAAEPPPEPGIVVPLDPVTVNLAEGHYLKFSIALQATKSVHEELDGSKALDIAIKLFSNMEVAELSSNKARAKVQKELVHHVVEAYHHEVMDVYFTGFVIQ